jgi:UDP-N-acetylmuramoyl-L-alanyl-D-glutamate--2,6-diaminopimelate ligase
MPIARQTLPALRAVSRRMERFTIANRTVLDDTAGHPESLRATFEVIGLLKPQRVIICYAVRGHRGADINRRNALALADLASLQNAEALIVTAASDVTGPNDIASPVEIDAARSSFIERGQHIVWHDTLSAAMVEVAFRSRPGDLIVLLGAQGMDEGATKLRQLL